MSIVYLIIAICFLLPALIFEFPNENILWGAWLGFTTLSIIDSIKRYCDNKKRKRKL